MASTQRHDVVDRAARDKLADAMVRYTKGEIDNFELDDQVFRDPGDDRTLADISLGVWLFYDDIKVHTATFGPEGWEAWRRLIAFLKSDLVFERKRRDRRPFDSVNY